MTDVTSVQPWGYAPTPVIPRVLLDDLGHLSIPQDLREQLNGCSTFQELYYEVWNGKKRLDPGLLNALVRQLGPKLRSLSHINVRSAASLHTILEDLPFSTRTRKVVLRNSALFLSEHLTIGDALRVPNLGSKSVLEFACVIEAATSIVELPICDADSNKRSAPTRIQTTPSELKSFFQLLAAYAAGERGAKTLDAALPIANEEWPPEIKHLWGSVGTLKTEELAGDLVRRYSAATLLEQWAGPIDERLFTILVRRTFETGRRDTLENLGAQLNVTRERVRQLEGKAQRHLTKLRCPEYGPIGRAAQRLRDLLGSAVPENKWNASDAVLEVLPGLCDLGDEMSKFTVGLMVYLAGPYWATSGWMLTDKSLAARSREDLLSRADDKGLITHEGVSDLMGALLIRHDYCNQWIEHLHGFKLVDGGYIYLKGTIADKAVALLKYYDKPLTVEEMLNDLGSDNVRSVRQRFIDDPRIWRINKQNQFVLAGTSGYDEYTGITDEIVQELEACGGEASVRHLISKLTSVYGVAESSVNAYLSTPIFTRTADGLVRLRRDDEPIELNLDIGRTAGCYINELGNWCWRVDVDPSLMRGSGRMTPNAFADLFGCGVGDKVQIDSDHGPVVFSWPATSTAGASIGSLRQAATDLDANIGDYLFVAKDGQRLSVTRLSSAELECATSKMGRLLRLVGREEVAGRTAMIDRLSAALQASGSTDDQRANACRLKLESRGEDELAKLVDETEHSVEDYLSRMEQLLKY